MSPLAFSVLLFGLTLVAGFILLWLVKWCAFNQVNPDGSPVPSSPAFLEGFKIGLMWGGFILFMIKLMDVISMVVLMKGVTQ